LAEGALAEAGPEWLTERRREGASLASELELPSQKTKGWEFTDLSALELDAFESGGARISGLPQDTPDGVVVMPLAEAAEKHPELVAERLGSVVPARDVFVARNAERWRDGVFVHVPAGATLTDPIELEIDAGDGEEVHWRTLVVLEDGAQAELFERYVSKGAGFFDGVVELVIGAGANLRYVCEQELSDEAWAFSTQRGEVERDGTLEWIALGFGSARGKTRMETKLAGKGSSAKVTGAYAGDGRQHLDYDTTQEHAAPHTNSDLAFRGVLTGRATSVWSGMIKVDREAQQTDAFQESRNLLLSKKSHADAIPGLEIEADDVRCTHAAAVAQVDREQLYYLTSRGLSEEDATRLVVEGFLASLVERVPEGPVRERIGDALERRLAELLD
jgi:Fe-S cluster assembly protein SufD